MVPVREEGKGEGGGGKEVKAHMKPDAREQCSLPLSCAAAVRVPPAAHGGAHSRSCLP